AHSVGVFLNGDAIAERDPRGRRLVDDSFLLLLNSHWEPVGFRLPPKAYGERWTALIDTADPEGTPDESEYKAVTRLTVGARSLMGLGRPPRGEGWPTTVPPRPAPRPAARASGGGPPPAVVRPPSSGVSVAVGR